MKRTFVRSEILLAQGGIALMRSEIWLRHVKYAKGVRTGEVVRRTKRLPGRGAGNTP